MFSDNPTGRPSVRPSDLRPRIVNDKNLRADYLYYLTEIAVCYKNTKKMSNKKNIPPSNFGRTIETKTELYSPTIPPADRPSDRPTVRPRILTDKNSRADYFFLIRRKLPSVIRTRKKCQIRKTSRPQVSGERLKRNLNYVLRQSHGPTVRPTVRPSARGS